MKAIFDQGVALLTEAGCKERQARSLLGKWRKAHGDTVLLEALTAAREQAISYPVEWLAKALPTWAPDRGGGLSPEVVERVMAKHFGADE